MLKCGFKMCPKDYVVTQGIHIKLSQHITYGILQTWLTFGHDALSCQWSLVYVWSKNYHAFLDKPPTGLIWHLVAHPDLINFWSRSTEFPLYLASHLSNSFREFSKEPFSKLENAFICGLPRLTFGHAPLNYRRSQASGWFINFRVFTKKLLIGLR